MAAPFDYSLNVASPIESLVQGLSAGQGIANMQAQRQQRDFQMQQQQAALMEAQRQAQKRAEAEAIQARFIANKTPTARDILEYSTTLPPEMVKALQTQFDSIGKEKQQNLLGLGSRVVSSLLSPSPQVAIGELTSYADGLEAAGDIANAKAYRTIAQVAEQDAGTALKMVAPMLATTEEGRKLIEAAYTAQAKPVELQKLGSEAKTAESTAQKAAIDAKYAETLAKAGIDEKTWNVKNLQSQIRDRAAKLGLDQQMTAVNVAAKIAEIQKLGTDIPADTRKAINDATITAATAQQSADQFNSLAARIAEAGGNYGVFSSASDFIKKAGGFQGGMTQLKQEYTRLRNNAAIKSLPPGPATDKDIQMVLSGFPSDTASATDLAQFLRGMAKLQTIDSNVAGAQAEWLAQNNGQLTRAKNAFTAGNFAARPGETFADLAKRIAEDVNKRYDANQLPKGVDLIPTPRNPNPQAADIRARADAIIGGR